MFPPLIVKVLGLLELYIPDFFPSMFPPFIVKSAFAFTIAYELVDFTIISSNTIFAEAYTALSSDIINDLLSICNFVLSSSI